MFVILLFVSSIETFRKILSGRFAKLYRDVLQNVSTIVRKKFLMV